MDPARILIVDDDHGHAEAMVETLERSGYSCQVASSGQEALRLLGEEPYQLVLTDLVMRGVDGMDLLSRAKKQEPSTEVIVMTGYGTVSSAVEAMKRGAADYLQKPLNIEELRIVVQRVLERQSLSQRNIELQKELDQRHGFESIIGNSPSMQKVFEVLPQISDRNVTVLITGETGTGKELLARALHYNSSRRNNRFVPLNCAALSEGILESELFGHEKGAFTGALFQRKGRFEFADKGTLFLDEVGDLPLSTQVKLLRVIESREIFRIGSNVAIPVDVRLLAATHRNLDEMIKEGKFRDDLYYRLRVVTLHLPPLRERPTDIPLLLEHFLMESNARHGKNIQGYSPEVRERLFRYPWPGNVRELIHCIENMVLMCRGKVFEVRDIPPMISPREDEPGPVIPALAGISLERLERELIRNTLRMTAGNREEAARILGIGARTLYRKLRRYRFTEEELRPLEGIARSRTSRKNRQAAHGTPAKPAGPTTSRGGGGAGPPSSTEK